MAGREAASRHHHQHRRRRGVRQRVVARRRRRLASSPRDGGRHQLGRPTCARAPRARRRGGPA